MTIDIDELERLAREATPGPWTHCGASDGKCPCRLVWSTAIDEPVAASSDGSGDWTKGRWQDQHFIAAANPQAVIELIADLRRTRDLDAIHRDDIARLEAQRDAAWAKLPAAPDLAIALRELRERRNSYAARHAQMVASQAAPEVIASYEKTLAEVAGAIAAIERMGGGM